MFRKITLSFCLDMMYSYME